MYKADNQEMEDGEREALEYLDRPTIYTGPATIQRPPSQIMIWLRSILGRQGNSVCHDDD